MYKFKLSTIAVLLIFITSSGYSQVTDAIISETTNEVTDELVATELPYYKTTKCDPSLGEELRRCALGALLADMYADLVYPEEASEEKVEGDVVVNFEIDETGSTINLEITEGIGSGCDEEAIRLISAMEFVPAKNKYGDVIVSNMSLYVRFRL